MQTVLGYISLRSLVLHVMREGGVMVSLVSFKPLEHPALVLLLQFPSPDHDADGTENGLVRVHLKVHPIHRDKPTSNGSCQ